MQLSRLDLLVFCAYLIGLAVLGVWLSVRTGAAQSDSKGYFLAHRSLPWWMVGGSLIASNISAEQFVGACGSGYAAGIAVAAYELLAAATLVIVAKYFLPVFAEMNISTMPEFIERRFDARVRTTLAVLSVLLFVFVNIASVLYLGALTIGQLVEVPLLHAIVGLALFAATFSIFGGLRVVVVTDFIQVAVLLVGGLFTTWSVLLAFGDGVLEGFSALVAAAPERFEMILDDSHPEYAKLPGIWVLLGGVWVANLYYWGSNQYIIQRTLAAKSLREAQRGTILAACVKILMPLILVLPGIAAYALRAEIDAKDGAYAWVLGHHVASGFKGLALAALVAAIGSSLSSMINSTATIFTLDIYKPLVGHRPGQSEQSLVRKGRIAAGGALALGALAAPTFVRVDQVFQFVQEYTGFISPAVVVVFLFGMFWKRASASGGLWVLLLSIPLSLALKLQFGQVPFLDRMGIAFVALSILMIVVSMRANSAEDSKAIHLASSLFISGRGFNTAAAGVCGVVAAVYLLMS